MNTTYASLHTALTGAKGHGTTAFTTSLAANGYKSAGERASRFFNSVGKGLTKNSLRISHAGVIANLFIIVRGTPIKNDMLPGPRDLIAITGGSAPTVIALGENIIEPSTREVMARPSQPVAGAPGAILVSEFLIGTEDFKSQGPLPYSQIYPETNPAGPGTAYWATETEMFAGAVDVAKIEAGGHRIPDRGTTSIAVEEFVANARPDMPTLVFYGGTGEYGHALMAAGAKDVTLFEAHPVLCAAADHANGRMSLKRDPEAVMRVVSKDPMEIVRAAISRTSQPLPNVVCEIPFVTSTAWTNGIPAVEVAGMSAPAGCLGALPPGIGGPTETLTKTESVGPAILVHIVEAMNAESVGTFVIPKQFGKSAKKSDELARSVLLSSAEVISYVEEGDYAILTLKRRAQKANFADLAARSAPRPSALSYPHVRWIGWKPVFVADRDTPGMHTGEEGNLTLKNSGLVTAISEPTPGVKLTAALAAGRSDVSPDDAMWVPVYTTAGVKYVLATADGIRPTDHADILLHARHEYGCLAVKDAPTGRFVTTNADFAVVAGKGKLETLKALLDHPDTARWIAAVSPNQAISLSVIGSIPVSAN